jgi:hypothetical protein
MLTACILTGIAIVCIEGVLWYVFCKKATGVIFPRETDRSYFRFFSITRMRILVVSHTIFLLSVIIFTATLLW